MKRILITRLSHQASDLAGRLSAAGAEPILIPTIALEPPTSFAALDSAIDALSTFDWLLFTSANAVEAFAKRALSGSDQPHLDSSLASHPCDDQETRDSSSLASHPGDDQVPRGFSNLVSHPGDDQVPRGFSNLVSHPGDDQVPRGFSLGSHMPEDKKGALAPGACPLPRSLKVAAIGQSTARAIRCYLDKTPDLIPPQAVAESFAEALLLHAKQGTRFLLVRAETARDHLPETLRAAGAEVTIAPAYRTVIPTESITALQALFANPASWPDVITFTSSSTATNLFALLKEANLTLPPEILRASIGSITSQILRDLGYPPQIEAPEAAIPSLVEILVKTLGLSKSS